MPKLYAPIRVKGKEGETFYRGFAARERRSLPTAEGLEDQFVHRRTSNTGLVFEPAKRDLDQAGRSAVRLQKGVAETRGLFNGLSNVAMCDGSVRRLRKDADEKKLKKLIATTRRGHRLPQARRE